MGSQIVDMTNREKYMANPFDAELLGAKFGGQFVTDVSLARFTSARIGGLADGLLTANSVDDLDLMVRYLWDQEIPFMILGGGSNVLVSDAGVRGLVLLNKARQVVFDQENDPPTVWAASGSNLGVVARQAAGYGLSGLEWASGIPGTIGGAIVGNAGAHGGDVAGNLLMAEILHREMEDKRSKNGNPPTVEIKREEWPADEFEFAYRSSLIKREKYGSLRIGDRGSLGRSEKKQPDSIILAALLRLTHSTKEEVEARIEKLVSQRQQSQPPGASMGSMFKNPEGDFAGRLIDQAGLKGTQVGDAAISSLHANFFINYGDASARDVWELINLARTVVASKFGVDLELEIELIGSWDVELN
jgi:UDP-N-acetylmuramate dehydrogenase